MKSLLKMLAIVGMLSSTAVFAAEPININKADANAIASNLSGVGEKRAQAIVQYREKNGPFKSLDELSQVKGVGSSITEKNAELILFK
jgi:competence protein ComEA